MKHKIIFIRVYEDYASIAGYKILIDRIWPRGISKEKAQWDEWIKEIAPSTALRKWFGHDPEKFEEFAIRYKAELNDQKEKVYELTKIISHQDLILLYGAKDKKHNQAIVLKEFILQQ